MKNLITISILILISYTFSGCSEKKVEPSNKYYHDAIAAEKAFKELDRDIDKLENNK